MSAKSQSTRDLLCEAAIRTASRDGLLSMTLDNVAREARVSKGGVMYHFPTKEQLVLAMVEYFGQRLERTILERVAIDPEPHNRWARALIDFTFPPQHTVAPAAEGATQNGKTTSRNGGWKPTPCSPNDSAEALLHPEALDQFFLAMLAAAVTNPGLLEPLRGVGKRLQGRLLSDPHGGLDQLLIWLVMDGLFLWQFVGLIDRNDPLFQRIGEELRRRVAASPAPPAQGDTPPVPARRRAKSPKRTGPRAAGTAGRSDRGGVAR
ncbi:MAG: TetR/AcrR family transcriptional regulator [Planctomycetaceae bacterium]|nr:MAG: TetR/AcrR family transcriptional regulator [Planctomycetaceae bacterium]